MNNATRYKILAGVFFVSLATSSVSAQAFDAKCGIQANVLGTVVPISHLEFKGNSVYYHYFGHSYAMTFSGNPNTTIRFSNPTGGTIRLRRVGNMKYRYDYRLGSAGFFALIYCKKS
jgi:hypothetical protein